VYRCNVNKRQGGLEVGSGRVLMCKKNSMQRKGTRGLHSSLWIRKEGLVGGGGGVGKDISLSISWVKQKRQKSESTVPLNFPLVAGWKKRKNM